MNKYIKLLLYLEVMILVYIYLSPFVHEFGHYIYSLLDGRPVEVVVTVPIFYCNSYVVAEGVRNPAFFALAGCAATLTAGTVIALFGVFTKYNIFLFLGLGLLIDPLFYPLFSFVTASGDFAVIDISYSIIFEIITISIIILLIKTKIEVMFRK
ncbi:MAG: hypothetical protein ACTSRP_09060 [Candidatus Helarchaeota archaeon]